MHSWLDQARQRAVEIHDVVQLAAGATALAALLIFVTLSGRSQDDPVVRWMAEVGATMIAAEIIIPAAPAKTDDAVAAAGAAAVMATSTAQLDALTYEPSSTWTARRSNIHPALTHY